MVTEKVVKRNLDSISRKTSEEVKENFQDFYSDVDRASLNFNAFWAGVIIILVVVFSSILTLGLATKRDIFSQKKILDQKDINLISFADRMRDVRTDGRKIMTFSPEEFASAVGVDDENFPLSSVKFDFSEDKIKMKGRPKNSLVFWPVTIHISHAVVSAKFKFFVAPDNFENIIVAADSKEKIEQAFEKNINNVLEKNRSRAEDIKFYNQRIELHLIKES